MSDINMDEIIETAPENKIIQNTLMKMDLKLEHYRTPVCSVSSGSDSDTMMDLIERVRGDRPVTYVFFDTGIEYEATKWHLDALEKRYGVRIERRDAVVPVPLGCKRYGLPFLTKRLSQNVCQLQRHNFQWEDEPFEALSERYSKCSSGLKWWCNQWVREDGGKSSFNIDKFPHLKEFMVAFPPEFRISDRCCQGAKKDTSNLVDVELDAGMKILGLRQSEGGARATGFTSCFTIPEGGGMANYRPLWFWTDADKAEYKEYYGVKYSDCYEVWGFKRTGCAGCPFNSRFEEDLKIMANYEPKLAVAAQNIFGSSYEYTRAYLVYKEKRKAEEKVRKIEVDGQTNLFGNE